jgi:hypothetical protein
MFYVHTMEQVDMHIYKYLKHKNLARDHVHETLSSSIVYKINLYGHLVKFFSLCFALSVATVSFYCHIYTETKKHDSCVLLSVYFQVQ